jgi:hypothetical protein
MDETIKFNCHFCEKDIGNLSLTDYRHVAFYMNNAERISPQTWESIPLPRHFVCNGCHKLYMNNRRSFKDLQRLSLKQLNKLIQDQIDKRDELKGLSLVEAARISFPKMDAALAEKKKKKKENAEKRKKDAGGED